MAEDWSERIAELAQERVPAPRYAGFWIRVGAHLIDSIIVLAVTFPIIYLLFGTPQPAPDPGTGTTVMTTVDLIVWLGIAVAVVLFWRFRGATPGKMLCGIRIVDANSLRPLSTGQCIGRYLGYIVSALPLLAGYLWVGLDRRKQGFHDKLASTVVVREADLAEELADMEHL